jgi:hypothetical protein
MAHNAELRADLPQDTCFLLTWRTDSEVFFLTFRVQVKAVVTNGRLPVVPAMSQNNWNLNDLGPQMLKDIAVEKARAESRLRIFSGTANPQLAQVSFFLTFKLTRAILIVLECLMLKKRRQWASISEDYVNLYGQKILAQAYLRWRAFHSIDKGTKIDVVDSVR